MSTQLAEPEVEDLIDTFTDALSKMDKAPRCEASPAGKPCHRQALYSGLITSHGCRRDGRTLLLCQQCRDKFSGGTQCAFHPDTVVFLVRAIKL